MANIISQFAGMNYALVYIYIYIYIYNNLCYGLNIYFYNMFCATIRKEYILYTKIHTWSLFKEIYNLLRRAHKPISIFILQRNKILLICLKLHTLQWLSSTKISLCLPLATKNFLLSRPAITGRRGVYATVDLCVEKRASLIIQKEYS